MNQPIPQKSKSGKRFSLFVILIVLLFAAFTAVWFWAANKVDETVRTASANLSGEGIVLDCKDQEVRGFPFRLGVFCASFLYVDPVRAVEAKAGAIRSAAQLYKPGHVIAEIDSPLDLKIPKLAPLSLNWNTLSTSANVTTSGFRRISLISKDFSISANDAGLLSPLATIDEIQIHARPTPGEQTEDGLDLAANLAGWIVANGGTGSIEAVDFNLDAVLENALSAIEQGQDILTLLQQNGAAGNIRDLRLTTTTGGLITISGPFTISKDGLVSAELFVNITDPKSLADYAGKVFPPAQSALEDAMPYLDGFPNNDSGKAEIKNLKLAIRNGEIMLGFFSIGQIPKLF